MRQVDRYLSQPSGGPREIEVIGVIPVCGGGGEAYPSEHAMWIEAMLTNPDDRLPELARLAWLVTQLRLPDEPLAAGPPRCPSAARQQEALLLTFAVGQQLDWFIAAEPPLTLAWQQWCGASAAQAQRWRSQLPGDWADQLLAQPGITPLQHLTSRWLGVD